MRLRFSSSGRTADTALPKASMKVWNTPADAERHVPRRRLLRPRCPHPRPATMRASSSEVTPRPRGVGKASMWPSSLRFVGARAALIHTRLVISVKLACEARGLRQEPDRGPIARVTISRAIRTSCSWFSTSRNRICVCAISLSRLTDSCSRSNSSLRRYQNAKKMIAARKSTTETSGPSVAKRSWRAADCRRHQRPNSLSGQVRDLVAKSSLVDRMHPA